MSLGLTFNPRNTAVSSRPGEERYMCKTVFTKYDLREDGCTEQKDVWIDWVKTFSVHPFFYAATHRIVDEICSPLPR